MEQLGSAATGWMRQRVEILLFEGGVRWRWSSTIEWPRQRRGALFPRGRHRQQQRSKTAQGSGLAQTALTAQRPHLGAAERTRAPPCSGRSVVNARRRVGNALSIARPSAAAGRRVVSVQAGIFSGTAPMSRRLRSHALHSTRSLPCFVSRR